MNLTDSLLQEAHRSLKGTVGRFSYQNQWYVAKKLQVKSPFFGQKFLTDLISLLLVKQGVRQGQLTSLPKPAADYEKQRLQSLHALGIQVPTLVAFDAELMVMTHCGTDGFRAMKDLAVSERHSLLLRLAKDLACFHQKKQWHGGAQIKNVLLDPQGNIYRIDFEEYFPESLPLVLAQAYDLLLFLNSIPLAGPITDAESRTLLPELLNVYFAANPNIELQDCLRHFLPYARCVKILLGPLRYVSRKSIRRIQILVDSLTQFLKGC